MSSDNRISDRTETGLHTTLLACRCAADVCDVTTWPTTPMFTYTLLELPKLFQLHSYHSALLPLSAAHDQLCATASPEAFVINAHSWARPGRTRAHQQSPLWPYVQVLRTIQRTSTAMSMQHKIRPPVQCPAAAENHI